MRWWLSVFAVLWVWFQWTNYVYASLFHGSPPPLQQISNFSNFIIKKNCRVTYKHYKPHCTVYIATFIESERDLFLIKHLYTLYILWCFKCHHVKLELMWHTSRDWNYICSSRAMVQEICCKFPICCMVSLNKLISKTLSHNLTWFHPVDMFAVRLGGKVKLDVWEWQFSNVLLLCSRHHVWVGFICHFPDMFLFSFFFFIILTFFFFLAEIQCTT